MKGDMIMWSQDRVKGVPHKVADTNSHMINGRAEEQFKYFIPEFELDNFYRLYDIMMKEKTQYSAFTFYNHYFKLLGLDSDKNYNISFANIFKPYFFGPVVKYDKEGCDTK